MSGSRYRHLRAAHLLRQQRGSIMGGALTAISTVFRRAVLGVPA